MNRRVMEKNGGGFCRKDFGLIMVVNLAELTTKDKKSKGKNSYVAEVIKHICSLLNGDGGKILVKWSEFLQETITEKDFTDFVRTVEQQMYEITDYAIVNNMETVVSYPRQIVFDIEPSSRLCTMNYNLCVPTETQVIALPSTEPVLNIKEIVERRAKPENYIANGTHHKYFVWKECPSSLLRESKIVQLKMLKAEQSKCVTLADRIISKSNRLANQVSAFANYRGGHIYIGIDPSSYRVEGVLANEIELNKVRTKVSKTLSKMIWPEHCSRLIKGKHWDIFFEPVKDGNGNPIPSTFVIVIYVAPCPGGVFTDEPESYQEVDGKVERMSLKVWRNRLSSIMQPQDPRCQLIQLHKPIDMVQTTPERAYINLSEYLQRLRKEGNWKSLESFTSRALGLENSEVTPLVAYQKILAANMKKEHLKAHMYLEEFQKKYAKNPPNFKVQEIYLQAVLHRSQGLYDKSYKLTRQGLEKAKSLGNDFTTGWFYCLIASLTAIRAAKEINSKEQLVEEAKEYNEKALRITERMFENPTALTDLQQTVYVNMALLSLDSSIKELNANSVLGLEAIRDAQEYLVLAQRPCVGARTMAVYNICQYLLAESDLQYRLSQLYPHQSLVHLKSAYAIAERARDMTRTYTFLELLDYSMIRLAFLTERLLFHRLNAGKKLTEQDYILRALTREKT